MGAETILHGTASSAVTATTQITEATTVQAFLRIGTETRHDSLDIRLLAVTVSVT